AKVGEGRAIAVEGAVQPSAPGVAGDGKVAVMRPGNALAYYNGLAVLLERQGGRNVGAAEIGSDLSVTVKGGIEASVRLEAHQGKVVSAAADRHDLAVLLDRHGEGHTRSAGAEVHCGDSIASEAGVRGAVRKEPRDDEDRAAGIPL